MLYVKLFSSIYQGTLRGNSSGLLVFTNLLAHADAAGHVDVHPRAIAEEVGLSLELVRAALDELEAPDIESRSPDEGGRRIVRIDEHRAWGWRIVNYGKYRAIKNEEDRREQNRLAQERWRNKNKQRKPPSAQAEAEAEAEAEVEETKTARKRAAPLALPPDVDPQVWADWLELRKKKRAPVTATVLDGARAEAEKAGMQLEQFLRIWCRRGSQGLEAEWLKQNERQPAMFNKQEAFEQQNRAVGSSWAAKMRSQNEQR
jgi:hypothetical protein